jgi:two-component system, LytTR family, sensor kinase
MSASTLASTIVPRAATLSRRRIGVLFLAALCDLGIWVLACLFAASEFYRRSIVMGGPPPWAEVLPFQMVVAFVWAMFTPLVVYIAQHRPLRDEHRIRNGLVVLAILPCLAIVRAALGGVVLNLGEHDPVSLAMIRLSVSIRTQRYIVILAVVFFVCYLVDAQREAARRERQRVRAQTLLARAELDELRTRLQPQFALRMLRHIGSVLRDQPAAADSLIVTLSSILRRSMGREGAERIRLADELEHLDRCLDLCRAGGRFSLTAHYLADDDVLASQVPALVLQPVIETVVLHLTAGAGGFVHVHCTREENETRIEVATIAASGGTFKDHQGDPHQSTAAIRARLATLYGEAASVQVAQRGVTMRIALRIPYEESATQDIPEEAFA